MIAYENVPQSIRSEYNTQPPEQPSEAVAGEKKVEKAPLWKTALKYLLHGFSFSILILFLLVFWALASAFLMVVGNFIGLIIGFLLLLFIVGGLNSFLTGLIWSVSIETNWKTLLVHGLVLFIALIVVAIPRLILNFVLSDFSAQVALLIVYAFIDGFIARKTGELFKEHEEQA